ncbi:hypothetical protein Lepto7375DRAFT_8435 [Leptolyngbya sp. PCC 7375]|nr:hypothetical protein Lepto7375DRAFT_8435 [Leptolyngbya sp. PCC 7375]
MSKLIPADRYKTIFSEDDLVVYVEEELWEDDGEDD